MKTKKPNLEKFQRKHCPAWFGRPEVIATEPMLNLACFASWLAFGSTPQERPPVDYHPTFGVAKVWRDLAKAGVTQEAAAVKWYTIWPRWFLQCEDEFMMPRSWPDWPLDFDYDQYRAKILAKVRHTEEEHVVWAQLFDRVTRPRPNPEVVAAKEARQRKLQAEIEVEAKADAERERTEAIWREEDKIAYETGNY